MEGNDTTNKRVVAGNKQFEAVNSDRSSNINNNFLASPRVQLFDDNTE